MSNETKNIRIGIVLSYANQFLSIAISLFYVPVMLSSLGQKQYGLYALAQSLVSYLTLTDIGIGTTAVRYNAKYIASGEKDVQSRINGMFMTIYSAIALICCFAGAILYGFIDKIYTTGYTAEDIQLIRTLFMIALVNLVITFVFKIYNSIITAYEKYIFSRVLLLIQTVINPLCLLAVLRMGKGAIGLLLVTTLLNLVSCLVQFLFCKLHLKVKFSFRGFEKKFFMTIFSFTLFIFLNTLATQLFTISDKMIIGIAITAEAVAVFAIVQQLENYYYSFSNIVTGVYMPRLTKMVTSHHDGEEMHDLFLRIGRIQICLSVFLFGGIAACGKQFIDLWLGAEYNQVYLLLLVVLFPQVYGAAQSLFTPLMQAMNLHKTRSLIGIGAAVVKVAVTVLFVHLWGLMGCAVAYTVMYTLRMVAYSIYYNLKISFDVWAYWRKIIGTSLRLLLLAILPAIPLHSIPMDGYLQVLLWAGAYTVFFFLGCWLLVFNPSEKDEIKQLLSRFIKVRR